MNAPLAVADWTAANQALLVTEVARLKARLGRAGEEPRSTAGAAPADAQQDQSIAVTLAAAQAALPAPAAIDRLTQLFALTPFERDLVLLCAGVELDAELARRCGEARGQPGQTHATLGLALATLAEPHWSALTPERPLRRWRLLEIAGDDGLTTARLRIDERILHYLAGINAVDTRLAPLLRPLAPVVRLAECHAGVVAAVGQRLANNPQRAPLIQLIGDDPSGQEDVAAAVAAEHGLGLFAIQAEDLADSASEADAFATLWAREAALLPASLLIACPSAAIPPAVARLLEHLAGLAFIAAAEPLAPSRADWRPSWRFRVARPSAKEQRDLWQQALAGPLAAVTDPDHNPPSDLAWDLAGPLAAQFNLSTRAIGQAADALPLASAAPDAAACAHDLWTHCRDLARTRLDDLAERIDPVVGWDDLILPASQQATLRRIAAHQRHRLRVIEDFGFASKGNRGLGLGVLFAGESGTGKTMAAEVLAQDLALDLYRIDLSAVVSKYIGETEKNLRRLFDAAEDSGAILLFDEADALFGKRSEVKDSHDRYANIEVSYLLARMESYRGLAILTTNHKAALDSAFQRRLRFILSFPFPDQTLRGLIWRRMFPAATPLADIDWARLARLNVTGGSIRNIALNAAFLAAEADGPVTMARLLEAAHLDAAKRDKPLIAAEIRGWV